MMPLRNRRKLPGQLNELGLIGNGVEVGVRQGRYSRVLLDRWHGSLLVLVDAWRVMPEMGDSAGLLTQDQMDGWYKATVKRTAKFGDRVTILQMLSDMAAESYPDGFFDFIYIDANHGYDAAGRWGIVQDLSLWWPKLKVGGLFSGHDYYNGNVTKRGGPEIVEHESDADLSVYGVKKAVDEFAARVDAEVLTTSSDKSPSWYWIK